MRYIGLAAAIAVFAFTGACPDRKSTGPQNEHHLVGRSHGAEDICPVFIKNADVSFGENPRGAIMNFVARSDGAIGDMQRRVKAMHAWHLKNTPRGTDGPMPAADVSMEMAMHGARLIFTAPAGADPGPLKAFIKERVATFQKGGCIMAESGRD
jgi:hypothetical protein